MKQRTFLQAKIHRATVTSTDLNYEGSITIDRGLLRASGILPYEWVQVVDLNNGARLDTYVIAGEAGSGVIQLNGAAAHLVHQGDKVIIMAACQLSEPLPPEWTPTVVLVDGQNQVVEIRRQTEPLFFK
jgi:aspartate 1-decarboxylase